jgi:hypothetical protein
MESSPANGLASRIPALLLAWRLTLAGRSRAAFAEDAAPLDRIVV